MYALKQIGYIFLILILQSVYILILFVALFLFIFVSIFSAKEILSMYKFFDKHLLDFPKNEK